MRTIHNVKLGFDLSISKYEIHKKLSLLQNNFEKIKYILSVRWNSIARILQSKDCKKIVEWINKQTPMLQDKSFTIITKIYWIIHNISDFPKCEIDYKPITRNVSNLRDGYGTTICSKKCQYIKMQKTLSSKLLKLYGVDNISKLDAVKIKKEQTTMLHYGVKNPSQSAIIQQKKIKTCLDRYGVKNHSQTEEFKVNMKSTKIKRYGKCRALNYTYKFNDVYFDSSWELAFWIYHVDKNIKIKREPVSFDYYVDGKKHTYYPDFQVNDKLYEIKGNRFFNDKMEPIKDGKYPWFEKYNCIVQNNIIILLQQDIKKYLDYVSNTYGKNYLKQFRINNKPCLYV